MNEINKTPRLLSGLSDNNSPLISTIAEKQPMNPIPTYVLSTTSDSDISKKALHSLATHRRCQIKPHALLLTERSMASEYPKLWK